jgi:uridine kinase
MSHFLPDVSRRREMFGEDGCVQPIHEAVEAALDRLSELRAGLSLVCIEGLGGAGKSTLAEALAAALGGEAFVVHGDDFYGPEERDWRSWSPREGYERYFDHRRLEREVLRPLRSGGVARFQRYDWSSNTLDGWIDVEPRRLVVVEGVYLLRPELRAYWDFAIYVEAPGDLRQARLRARGENDEGWISRWTAAEDYYERVDRPREAADLVVNGH